MPFLGQNVTVKAMYIYVKCSLYPVFLDSREAYFVSIFSDCSFSVMLKRQCQYLFLKVGPFSAGIAPPAVSL